MSRQTSRMSAQRTSIRCPNCQLVMLARTRQCRACGASLGASRHLAKVAKGNNNSCTAADAMALHGRVIDSKYKLIKYHGAGGMGTVYEAQRLHIGDRVAVKILSPECRSDATLVERFRREVSVAAGLCDSRVIAIYDTGETPDGIIYLVMPFVEAPTLREILEAEKRLTPERTVAIMLEVCGGVDAAHHQGIVHRDLKPENIMVLPPREERGREAVRVLDFGLAKPLNPTKEQLLTQPGIILGTPLYMSPEQYRGETIDTRSDVYSLGVILYELLTGQPPFTGYSLAELIAKHLMDEPKPMSHHLGVPPALEAAVRRALSKKPADRYADAHELARVLRTCLMSPATRAHQNRWQVFLNHFSSFLF